MQKFDAGPELRSVSPRSFTIENAILTSNDGNPVEIKNLVQDIKIHESLNMSNLIAEVYVVDAANLFFHMKLSGNEKLELVIFRIEPGNEFKEYSLVLNIVDITNFTEPSPSSKAYTLICMSKHAYLDKEKLLNIPFSGNTNDLIEKIVKSNLKSDIDIRCSTKNSITGIYPNVSPLDAISWLLRNSFDNNTEVYFYESVKDGLVLTSYNEMVNQDVFKEYNRIPYNTQTTYRENPEEGKVFKEEQSKIIKFSSELNLSKMEKTEDGAFGSTLNVIDIATKTVDNPTQFKYKLGKNKIINDIAPVDNTMTIGDNVKITDWTKYKQYYVSKNSLAFGNKGNYHSTISESLLAANSNFQNLDTTMTKIIIPGDFDMTPGKIISMEVPIQADISLELIEGKPFLDTFMSGHYLVSTIIHNFSERDGYTMKLSLKKDSFIAQHQLNKEQKESV